MFIRPRRIPEAVWACLGAGLLLALRLIPFSAALGALAKGYDVSVFIRSGHQQRVDAIPNRLWEGFWFDHWHLIANSADAYDKRLLPVTDSLFRK